ncbi:MAG: phospholipase D-like domain-containing protein [Syntrophales bacterium]|nr:phospholipase D-like domain-containing protein [Syntrophales bacterium]MDY0043034.1 phospholipase D-like domain-containing protein [Syntrophales bacterium]
MDAFKGIILILLLAMHSCAPALSDISLHIPQSPFSAGIHVQGDSPTAVLNRLSGDSSVNPGDFPVAEVLRIEQAITNRPLVSGNRVELLIDGPHTFEAMFAAMRSALHHIHIETFIIDDEEIGGQLADILIERRKAGVEVRLIYDAFGALEAKEKYFEKLRHYGIQLHEYNPIDPSSIIRLWRINNRHHRKITVVDGRIGFTGGLNFSGVYASSSSGYRKSLKEGWRDTHIKVEGPAVAQLQRMFVNLWAQIHDEPILGGPEYFPPPALAGRQLIRLADSKAGDSEVDIYTLYMTVIKKARARIWITQGYFSPDRRMLDALKNAAGRNVDVRLLLPGLTDSWITINSSRAHYTELLESGVRIFERRDALQHAKTAVVDGIWSTVGSANLDSRSFLHSNEANIIIWGRDFSTKMEELFIADQQKNMEIDLKTWSRRPFYRKLMEKFAGLFDYWL